MNQQMDFIYRQAWEARHARSLLDDNDLPRASAPTPRLHKDLKLAV